MMQRLVSSEYTRSVHFPISPWLACLMLLVWFSTGLIAQNPSEAENPTTDFRMRVTHVLGLTGVSNNTNGNLSIQAGALQFQSGGSPDAQISIGSIQDVFLGEQDKQVGGTPMTVGKIAAPFGGGRVIGLFAHKKYDILTVEFLDSNGGLHGAIFQLNKGQGNVVRSKLMAEGAHITQLEDSATRQSTSETKNENK